MPQLRQERVPPSNWRRVFGTLLALVLVFASVNVAVMMLLKRHPVDRQAWLIARKWRMLQTLDHPVDCLILGDSSGLIGVIPNVLNEKLHYTRSLNLCTIMTMLVANDAWMLDTYLKRFPPPRQVLLVHAFDIWQDDKVEQFEYPDLPWGYWRHMTPSLTPDRDDEIQAALSRYLPLYAHSGWLARTLEYPWELHHFYMDENGYMPVSSAYPGALDEDVQTRLKRISGRTFKMSSINQASLARIEQLAEKYDIDVRIVNGPVYDGLYRTPAFTSYYRQVLAGLNSELTRSRRMSLVFSTPQTFAHDQMENVVHLLRPAAEVFTQRLGDELMRTIQRVGAH